MTKNKHKKNLDILADIGNIRPMRLNNHTVMVVTPKKTISLKEGQKKLRAMLTA